RTTSISLGQLCLLRGVNGYALSACELEGILLRWTDLSVKASATSHSYRLHLPFLLNFKQHLR
uniref:Ovule protein n=1 Tax=Mesocestoides corti TaxID=53468 RepID=A0A5K3FAJ9_MESCO